MHLSKPNSRRLYGLTIVTLLLFSVFIASFKLSWISSVKAQGNWLSGDWLGDWSYRREIRVNSSKVDGDLTDFPVLVYLGASSGEGDTDVTSVFDVVGSDYNAIAFAGEDGERYYFEVEEWDDVGEEAWVWVKLNVNSTSDSAFYIYYDSAKDGSAYHDSTQVWDSSFKMVQHMQESSSPLVDSTSNSVDVAGHGNPTYQQTGKIDGAVDFDGSDDYFDENDVGNALDIDTFTVEAWVKADAFPTHTSIVDKRENYGTAWDVNFQLIYDTNEGKFRTMFGDGGSIYKAYSDSSPSTGTWYYLVGWYDKTVLKMFVDGAQQTGTQSTTATPNYSVDNDHTEIGSQKTAWIWDGIIDEVRVSDIARSSAWIKTTYKSATDNLLNFGNEETLQINRVTLNSPSSGSTVTSWTIQFNYTPTFYQTIQNACLWTDEGGWSRKHWNGTLVKNNTENSISETFSSEGTYMWTIEVYNSTDSVFAPNRTVTVDVAPRYRNVGSRALENGTMLLHGEAYDGIGLDQAWLWTNETGGTGKNYTIIKQECVHSNGTVGWYDTSMNWYQRGILYNGKLYDTESDKIVIRNWTTMQVIDSHTIGSVTNVAPSLDYSNEEIVYAAGQKGEVIAYNTTSKTEVWRRIITVSEHARYVDANYLELHEDHLYVLLTNYTIFKLDKTDGSTVDTFVCDYHTPITTGSKMFRVDADNNRIYAVGYSKLHAINLTDMTEIWHVDLPAGAGDGGRSSPVVINDTSYSIQVGLMNDDITYNFDFDGNQNWNATIPGGVRAVASYSPKTKYVYVTDFHSFSGGEASHWYAFNVTTGELIWKIRGPRNDHFTRPLTISGDYGLFHTNNHDTRGEYLYVINMTDGSYIGEVSYSHLPITHLVCYPIIVSGGKAVSGGGGGGILIQFDLGEGEYVDYKYLYGNSRYGYVDERGLTCYGEMKTTCVLTYGSPLNMSGLADTWAWSNFTWCNSSITAGTTIQWRIYYNDTYGNIAPTGIHIFSTLPILTSPTFTATAISPTAINLTSISIPTDADYIMMRYKEGMKSPWWNSSWNYKKQLSISNPVAGYQMILTVYKNDGYDNPSLGIVDCEGHCNDDFSDLRFVNTAEDTELAYWIENKTDGDHAVVWVKTAGASSIYMYYGNPDATTTSNGTATFSFFEDFTDSLNDLIAGQWEHWANQVYTSDGVLYLKGGNGPGFATDNSVFCLNQTMRFRTRFNMPESDENIQGVWGVNPSYKQSASTKHYCGISSSKPGVHKCMFWSGDDVDLDGLYFSAEWAYIWQTYEVTRLSDISYGRNVDADEELSSQLTLPGCACIAVTSCTFYSQYLKVDWILVREYADPEPAWSSFGSEEDQYLYPANRTDGTQLFFGSAPSYYLHTDLKPGTMYGYSAWAYNSTHGIWSSKTDRGATTPPVTTKLEMNPVSVTCHKYCENFTIIINITDAYDVEDFEFEIHFSTTLLDYVNITWNAWGSGTLTIDEANGNLTGYTSGSPITGNATLVTITFHAAYHHIWKDCQGWTNILTGTIYIQWANLSYPDSPDLRYEKGVLYEINVDPIEVVYTFSPIQGDVDNDGDVDIMDLRTVAAYYNQDYDKYDLNCDGIVDIFDLVIIAVKFGTTYP